MTKVETGRSKRKLKFTLFVVMYHPKYPSTVNRKIGIFIKTEIITNCGSGL